MNGMPESSTWPFKEVNKISLLSNRWSAEIVKKKKERKKECSNREHDVLPTLSYLGLTYKMEYVSSLSLQNGLPRDSKLDPRITEYKEDQPFLPTNCGL